MNRISAQVSLYPLRQAHLSASISGMLDALRSRGLVVKPEAMSTLVVGEAELLFDGLKAAFQSVVAATDVVMIVSFSNCCPIAAE